MKTHIINNNSSFTVLTGLCLFILFGLLPGFANGADVPKTVTTDPIVFTGLWFEPKSVTTDSIVFTGLRFEPKSVKTDSILFTGLGQETTVGLSGSKALLVWKGQKEAKVSSTRKFGARTVKLGGKTKTMLGGVSGGFVPRNEMKTRQGKALAKKGFGLNKGPASVAKHKIAMNKTGIKTIKIPKPYIVIETLTYNLRQPGNRISLNILFRNKGKAKNSPDAKYKVQCRVKKGGPNCPVSKNRNIKLNKIIGPGQTARVLLMSPAPAKPGKYLVSVSTPAGSGIAVKSTGSLFSLKNKQLQPGMLSVKHIEIKIKGGGSIISAPQVKEKFKGITRPKATVKPMVKPKPEEKVKPVAPLKKQNKWITIQHSQQ